MKQLHFFQGVTEDGLIPVYYIALNEAATDILSKTGNRELDLLTRPVATMLEGLTIRIANEEQYQRYDRYGNLREMSLVDFINALQTMDAVDFAKMINDIDNPSEPKDFDSEVGDMLLHYHICPSWLEVTVTKINKNN